MTGGEKVAQLTGTGRLADDLYLMSHHDVTGRPYLQPRALGLGLAGGLLAELVLVGRIEAGPRVVVVDPASPRDGLAARVLREVAAEGRPRPAAEWLTFLARTAAADVAARLAEAGYLTPVTPKGLRRGARWVPADSDCAFVALTRARAALDPACPVTATGAALAGLAAACGLASRLLAYAPRGGGRRPEAAALILWPGLHELIAQTRAAVDSSVLAHRM